MSARSNKSLSKLVLRAHILCAFFLQFFLLLASFANAQDVAGTQLVAGTAEREILTIPLPEELGNRLRQLLAAGDFQRIESFFQGLISSKLVGRDGVFYAASAMEQMFPKSEAAFSSSQKEKEFQKYRQITENWVKQSPSSAVALLVRGVLSYNFGSQVSPAVLSSLYGADRLKLELGLRLQSAEKDLQTAVVLEPENFLAKYKLLELSANLGQSRQALNKLITSLRGVSSRLPAVFLSQLVTWQLEARNEPQKMLAFARSVVSELPQDSPCQIVLPEAHRYLIARFNNNQRDSDKVGSNNVSEQAWLEISATYQRLIDAYPEFGGYLFNFAEFAQLAGRHELSTQLLTQARNREPENPYLAAAIEPLEKSRPSSPGAQTGDRS